MKVEGKRGAILKDLPPNPKNNGMDVCQNLSGEGHLKVKPFIFLLKQQSQMPKPQQTAKEIRGFTNPDGKIIIYGGENKKKTTHKRVVKDKPHMVTNEKNQEK